MNRISLFIGKTIQALSRLKGGGSALPGLVVEKIDPNFLKKILGELPYGVVVISGTNGKTTTTKIVSELLEKQGLRVFTNETGSNFVRGVISALLNRVKLDGKFDYDIAVLELDEAHAVKFCEVIDINYALLLNVQRDQLDRFGEIDHTAVLMQKVATAAKKSVVLNREDSRIAKLKCKKPVYFGLAKDLLKQFPSDDNLIANTGKQNDQVEACVTLVKLSKNGATYKIEQKNYDTDLALRGIYNAYNAAGAIALCQQIMPQVEPEKWLEGLSKIKSAFGRGETFTVEGTTVELLLVKNPSAFQLSLKSFVDEKHQYMIAINDNFADGQDVSWLWNVDFSLLPFVEMVSGTRAADMALRLKYDEVGVGHINSELAEALSEFLRGDKKPKRIFATYTAMLAIRKIISGRSIL